MTYCVGILVSEGLVMIADTRTNAGVDNIAVFRKLHVFETPGERVITVATAGNLSISQSVLALLSEGIEDPQTGERETLLNVPSMVRAARLVGRAIRQVYAADGADMERRNMSFDVTLLLGGQIGNGTMRLYQLYSAGNAIEATEDTPFLQIGEPKYGKPILDRAVSPRHRPRRGAKAWAHVDGFDPEIQSGCRTCRSTSWWRSATPCVPTSAIALKRTSPISEIFATAGLPRSAPRIRPFRVRHTRIEGF